MFYHNKIIFFKTCFVSKIQAKSSLRFVVSREGANQGEGSTIRMEFAAHLYNDATFVGQNYWLGSAFEIGSSQIWAGQLQITGAAPIDPTGMVSSSKQYAIVSF